GVRVRGGRLRRAVSEAKKVMQVLEDENKDIVRHRAQCMICQADPQLADTINHMIIRRERMADILRYARDNGLQLSPQTYYRHRRWVPALVSREKVAEILREQTNLDQEIFLRLVSQIHQAQAEVLDTIWGVTIPCILNQMANVSEKEGDIVKLAEALDTLVKVAMLTDGKATERREVLTSGQSERFAEHDVAPIAQK